MCCFKNWDESRNLEPEQIKRRLNGEKIKSDKVTVNREAQTAEIVGSSGEVYAVSLAECSCMDYYMKKSPCKHMYRLADELGVSNPFPAVDRTVEDAFITSEAARYREAFLSGQISAQKYAKVIDALNSK